MSLWPAMFTALRKTHCGTGCATVKGVRVIAEEIEVRLPENEKAADDEIASRVVKILAWGAQLPTLTTARSRSKTVM